MRQEHCRVAYRVVVLVVVGLGLVMALQEGTCDGTP